jgi:1,4-alpha-glucan branching enzyme
VVVAPFDTELYGHWWFEGVEFLGAVYRRLREQNGVRPVTARQHLDEHPPRTGLRLAEGSWGANGDHSMWLNDRTAWMWQRLWALEDAFWDVAPAALASPAARPVLAQAARELLLAEASDWEFIVSTGVVADYGVRRFELHCADAERLVAALAPGGPLEGAERLADELWHRDGVFPDILASVAVALSV